MKQQLNIPTPLGPISVENTNDPHYPGVWVSVNGQRLVLIDYSTDSSTPSPNISVRVWDPENDEDDYEYKKILKRKEGDLHYAK